MSAPPFFPCYAEDAMSGILKSMMTPEQVGCYFMLLCMEWTEQGPLSATEQDDWRRLAVRTGWDIRLVRRLVNEVVAHGKYELKNGKLRNMRMQAEISKYVRKVRARDVSAGDEAAGAVADGVAGGSTNETATQVANELASRTAIQTATQVANPVANEDLSQKGNEINGGYPPPHVGSRKNLELRTQNIESLTPLPPDGGVVAESAAKPKRAGQVESQRSVSAAFDLWNAFATEHGLGRLEVQSESRRSKLARRLAEIGGLDRFKLALSMIPTDDFLMGRVPPRAGDKPFRLDFERLMSTGSGLGDVLARMIEKAIQKLAPVVAEAAPAERLPREFWWRGREEIAREVTEESWETLINRCANGIWPEQFLGPLPGTAKCLVPAVLIKKLNLIERYGNRAEPRMVDETHGTDE